MVEEGTQPFAPTRAFGPGTVEPGFHANGCFPHAQAHKPPSKAGHTPSSLQRTATGLSTGHRPRPPPFHQTFCQSFWSLVPGLVGQRSFAQTSLASARADLASLLVQARSECDSLAATPLSSQPVACLAGCNAAASIAELIAPASVIQYVIKRSNYSQVRKVAGGGPAHLTTFGARAVIGTSPDHADYELSESLPSERATCANYFPIHKTYESSSFSSSSESQRAPQVE